PHQDDALRVAEDPLDQGDAEDQSGIAEQRGAADLDTQGVDRAADEQRAGEADGDRGDDRQQSEPELAAVAGEIGPEGGEALEQGRRAPGAEDTIRGAPARLKAAGRRP